MGRHFCNLAANDEEPLYHGGRTFMSLLKACSVQKNMEKGCELHAEIARFGILENDAFVGSSLVDMYAKCGSLGKAQEVFDTLMIRDVVTWTALIAGYAEHGHGMEALTCVKQMERDGFLSDSHVIVCCLKACGSIGALNRGQELHAQIIKRGFDSELFVGNALVDLYARYGLLESAHNVFSKLLIRDVVSWNALITGYAEHEHGTEVFRCLEEMHHEGISPNSVSFVGGLKGCGGEGASDRGRDLHFEIMLRGLEDEVVIANALVNMYAKIGLFEAAEAVFKNLWVRDVVCWTALLAGYTEHGRGEEALDCFHQMQKEGAFLNVVTYICALKACSSSGAIVQGKVVHIEIVKRGLDLVILVGNSLVDIYAKCGLLETARNVFAKLPTQDVVLWNALIAGYAEHGYNADALDCLDCMHHEGIPLNSITFICCLKACGNLKAFIKGCLLNIEIIKRGSEKEPYVGSSLVDMYSKCGFLGEAHNVLDMLELGDTYSQNALIAGYAQQKHDEEALDCFELMQQCVAPRNVATYVCSLKACGSLCAVNKSEEIYAEATRRGLEIDLIVGSCVVDMYVKCGLLAEAQLVFAKLAVRDVLSWNMIITGFAQLGESSHAFNTFTQMTSKGLEPDLVTFVSILNACSHAGLIIDGVRCFDALKSDYGLLPTLEHYNCMIDILCRAGCMDMVAGLAKDIPLHPDNVVWHTILGACQKFGDVELGWQILGNVLLSDENDIGAFVSMHNVCVNAFVDEEAQEANTPFISTRCA